MWNLCTHSSAFLKAVQPSNWIYQNKGILAFTTQKSPARPILQEQHTSLITKKPSTPQICQHLNCNSQY